MRAIAGAGMIAAMLVVAGTAGAQRAGAQGTGALGAGASYPVPGRAVMPAPPQQAIPARAIVAGQQGAAMRAGPRWATRQGRWAGGWNAPGGWNGYRQPYAGWALPPYWVQPGFVLGDWSAYGLARPRAGQRWSRYYDDAVLIDDQGSVYDTVGGIDWNHYDGGNYALDGDRGRPPSLYLPERRDPRAGGSAIDKGEDRGRDRRGYRNDRRLGDRRYDRKGYDDRGYSDRGYGAGYPPPPVAHEYSGGEHWVSQDGHTIVTTNGVTTNGVATNGITATDGPGYYGGGTTTTVTVQRAPVVTTTTTTEYFEDAPRRTWRAKRRATGKALCCRR